ncbi:hypothetical protein ACFQ36_01340 [Arthrobacter sp. GCM10027362]|uniref:hypothetical protein n=1 Tax=Arthrobacter sp. GCM10027362 TaxID=3273379 RepID=UPI003625C67B
MNGKLKVLVRVDLEGSSACIGVKGAVNTRNVQALYSLAKRASSLAPGLDVAIDLSAATAEPKVLDELRTCADSHHLPESVDPMQTECRLRVITQDPVADSAPSVALAA